jgi:hypothetical protein
MDKDAVREDGPLTLSNTMFRTHVAEVHRVSSSVFASRRAASSALRYPVASSRRLANRAQPGGDPRSRLQILAAGHSRCKCDSSSL